jgi:hypothetical protein
MHILACIFFEVHPLDVDRHRLPFRRPSRRIAISRHYCQLAVRRERFVVLRDLVALRQVGIKVILSRKDGRFLNLQSQRESSSRTEVDGSFVQDRQCARQAEADRTRIRIWLRTGLNGTAAENFCGGRELCMNFHADYRFPAFFDHKKIKRGL